MCIYFENSFSDFNKKSWCRYCCVVRQTFLLVQQKLRNQSEPWWRHQMETFFALLALCVGNSPVTGEFLAQRLVARNSDASFHLRLNKRLRKQPWGWWFETPSRSSWLHLNAFCENAVVQNNLLITCSIITQHSDIARPRQGDVQVRPAKDTSYLALTGDLCSVLWEYFGKKPYRIVKRFNCKFNNSYIWFCLPWFQNGGW